MRKLHIAAHPAPNASWRSIAMTILLGWTCINIRTGFTPRLFVAAFTPKITSMIPTPSLLSPPKQCRYFTTPTKSDISENDLFQETTAAPYEQGESESFRDYRERMEALAFLSSTEENAAQRAEALFEEMLEKFCNEDDDETLRPTTHIYNLLMNAHSWSNEAKGAIKAESVLNAMETADDEYIEEIGASPDVKSYVAVIDGYANRKRPRDAQRIFNRLLKNHESTDSECLKPNTGAYNRMIKAWMMSKDDAAPQTAENLLREMIRLYKDGDLTVKPNRKTFALVITTHAHSNQNEAAQNAQAIYDTMERLHHDGNDDDDDLKPNSYVVNALIKAYANSKGHAQTSEDLLRNMIRLYQSGDDCMKPDGASFINCINAWARSNDAQRATKSEELLQTMQELYRSGDDHAKPTVKVYNAVINAISRSAESDKAKRAYQLLQNMIRLDDDDAAPNLRSYNSVLNSCAFSSPEHQRDRMTAFQIAVATFNELRESKRLNPDHVSYGMFLRMCATILPENKKRDKVVEAVFKKCCRDGQVGDFVLGELPKAASRDLCKRLLLGGNVDDGVGIPVEWRSNVKLRK